MQSDNCCPFDPSLVSLSTLFLKSCLFLTFENSRAGSPSHLPSVSPASAQTLLGRMNIFSLLLRTKAPSSQPSVLAEECPHLFCWWKALASGEQGACGQPLASLLVSSGQAGCPVQMPWRSRGRTWGSPSVPALLFSQSSAAAGWNAPTSTCL